MLTRPWSLLRPLLLLTLLPTLAWSQGLRFTTLDIGQGDAAVLIAPGGCVALFDGGPTGSGDTIKAYLKQLGVTRIDMAFVSHMHADHMGGIDEVDVGTDAVSIDAVYDHGGTYNSTAYNEYVSHFSGRRIQNACPIPIYSSNASSPGCLLSGTATSSRIGPILV